MQNPVRVLFLSDANAARSQMAEALLHEMGGDGFQAHSAGFEPLALNPLAVRAMAEIGVDIAGQRAKHIDEYLDTRFDYSIVLCSPDQHFCPDFPHDVQTLHWVFEDPGETEGTEDAKLAAYRRVRDAIRLQLDRWLAALRQAGVPGQHDARAS